MLRVVTENGRFASDRPRSRALQKSSTVWYRCEGSLARAVSSTRSNPLGASGRSARSGRARSVTCFAIVARALAPLSGGSPASIS